MKHILTALLAVFLVTAGSCQAQSRKQPQNQGASRQSNPQLQTTQPNEILKEGLTKLGDFLASDKSQDPKQVRDFLDQQIAPYFAFDLMARWVARPLFDQLPPKRRKQLQAHIKQMFLAALAGQLKGQENLKPHIDVLPPLPTGPDAIEIGARVMPAYGYPVRLGFRFFRTRQGWKVVDASSDGISAVRYYRQAFLYRVHHPEQRESRELSPSNDNEDED